MASQPATTDATLPPRAARTLAAHSLALATSIDALREKHQLTTTTAAALVNLGAQATAIGASLSQLHALLLRDGDGDVGDVGDDARDRRPALDAALTACAFAFACLDAEVQRLSSSSSSSGGTPPGTAGSASAPEAPRKWRMKRSSTSAPTQTQQTQKPTLPKWREDAMKELSKQLRGLRAVLAGHVRALLAVVREPGDRAQTAVVLLGGGKEEDVGKQVARGSKALRAAWPAVEVPDLTAGEEGGMGFVQAVVESPAWRAAVAEAETMRDPGGRADAGADERVDGRGVEDPGEDGEPGPSAAQAVPGVDGVVEENAGQKIVAPGELRDEAVAAETASKKSQKAASNADANLEEDQDAPPLPPREQISKENEEEEEEEEEEAPPPPLPPRRPTASPPAVPSSSTADVPAPSTDGPDHTEDPTTSPPRPSADADATATAPQPTPPPAESSSDPAIPPPSVPPPPPPADPTPLRLSPRELLIRRHWQTLLLTELRHTTALHALLTTLRTSPTLHNTWPSLLPHLDGILPYLADLVSLHARHLLRPLALQLASVVKTDLLLPVFRVWWRKAGATVMALARRVPHAVAAVRATVEGDGGAFRAWVVEWVGVEGGLEGLLVGSAVGRVGEYCEVLGAVEALEGEDGDGVEARSTQVGDYRRMMVRVRESCEKVMREAADAEELRDIHRRIQTLNYHHVEALDMFNAGRRMVFQGPLACRTKGKGLWNQVHCVLLDNYFFWGRVERPREMWFGKYKYGEKLWVLEAPMPVQQLECSFDAASDVKTKASIIDNVPRGSELFVFSVKAGEAKHLMAAATSEDRQTWVNFLQSLAA